MPTLPAEDNTVAILANDAASYQSSDVVILINPGSDLITFDGSPTEQSFFWSMIYDTVTPLSGDVLISPPGGPLTFAVPSGDASFALTSSTNPNVPAQTLAVSTNGTAVTLEELPLDGPPGSTLGLTFNDPAVGTADITWQPAAAMAMTDTMPKVVGHLWG